MQGRKKSNIKMTSGGISFKPELLEQLKEVAKKEGRYPNQLLIRILEKFQADEFSFKPFIDEEIRERFQYYIPESLLKSVLSRKNGYSDFSNSHFLECVVYSYFKSLE